MGRYTAEGGFEPTTLFEAATRQYPVKVACRNCGHFAVFHPHGIWWHFHKRGWVGIFSSAAPRFWCQDCRARTGQKVKRAWVSATKEAITITLRMPDEREWKRALSRYR